ncbi:MAG: S8 family serine peptidase [Bauldia sp.]
MAEMIIDGWLVELDPQIASFRSEHYYVTEVTLPQEPDFRNAVREGGGTVLERIPAKNDSDRKIYLYHSPGGNPLFSGSMPFQDGWKLPPTLLGQNPGVQGLSFREEGGEVAALPGQRVQIDLHATADVDGVVAAILDAAGVAREAATVFPAEAYTVPPNVRRVKPARIVLAASGSALRAISAIEGVRRIASFNTFRLANNSARRLLAVPGDPRGERRNPKDRGVGQSAGEEFAGEGEVIVIADSGFDRGLTQLVDFAFRAGDGTSRVLEVMSLGGRSVGDDPVGHGTHVAGSAVGGEFSRRAENDGSPGVFGVAYRAKLVVQSLFRDNFAELWGLDYRVREGDCGPTQNSQGKYCDVSLEKDIFIPPYNKYKTARIHSNSWGDGSEIHLGTYGRAKEIDEVVTRYRDLTILFCAGNSGEPEEDQSGMRGRSIWVPGTAKNCITVGACENLRDYPDINWSDPRWHGKFDSLPTKGEPIAGNPEAMAPFSSRGPADRSRIKPDVVAPGTSILSTRSYITMSRELGLSREEPNRYMYWAGTSMATPLVAGCAAIVREYLRKKRGFDSPSAALVKAALINGARPITGPYSGLDNGGTIPNNSQGFGRVDVSAALGLDGGTVTFIDESVDRALSAFVADGEPPVRWLERMNVEAGKTLKVTLVWTDPPGEALENDLDLIVRAGGHVRHGNMSQDDSERGLFDTTNNVEQVVWDDLPAGEVVIEVNAAKVPDETQTFALVYRLI